MCLARQDELLLVIELLRQGGLRAVRPPGLTPAPYLPQPPRRMIEENFWRAIRYGLSGSLLDPATYEVRPARAELERLAAWIGPVADELGVQLTVPATTAAERQIARVEEGWQLEEIYAEQVRAGEVVVG